MLLLRIDWLGQDGIRRTAVFMQGRQQITLKSDPPKIWGLKKGVRIYIITNKYILYIYQTAYHLQVQGYSFSSQPTETMRPFLTRESLGSTVNLNTYAE